MQTKSVHMTRKFVLRGGSAIAALLLVQTASAQTANPAITAVDETQTQDLVVIGTRRTDRSVTDSASA